MPPIVNTVRISAAALCWIPLGDKFLLEVNKNRGDVITPLGGALEYHRAAEPALKSLDAKPEKLDNRDIRLQLPENHLGAFGEWFASRNNRETSPFRELQEELVQEHKALAELREHHLVQCSYLTTLESTALTDRKGIEGMKTHYFHEIFLVSFIPALEDALLHVSQRSGSRLVLVSEDEVESGAALEPKLPISEVAKAILTFARIPKSLNP